MSTIFFDKVIVTSINSTTARVMCGGSVGNLNEGVTTDEQGLLVPDPAPQNSLPQLTATAYLQGVPLDPQPGFLWESSNPCVCAIDQNGNCTRVTNDENLTFDSNGAANLTVQAGESFLGGLAQITATALYPNGAQSGVRGTINVVVQAQAARQFQSTIDPAARNAPSSNVGFYDLVE